ncbi:MAG: ABC transporter ATP-binding protein [Dethiobacteria bacterium]
MKMAIETWGLTKRYRSVVAVNNVYLRLPRGKIHGLLGPGGAGKTTFLKLLMGFKKPTSGGGFCLGYDIISESINLREKLGYVSGDNALYDFMTVREMISFTRNFFPSWDEQLVDHYLDCFALPANRSIRKLGHAHRTLLALILALAHEPELLLLDEPTINFRRTPEAQIFFEALSYEQARKKMAVLLASGSLDEIKMISGELSLMYRGKLLKNCMVQELSSDELPADVEELCLHYLKGEKKT